MANGTDDLRYRRVLKALADARKGILITQAQLARKLRKSQLFVSKYESGERRLDAIEFADICYALVSTQETCFSMLRHISSHAQGYIRKSLRILETHWLRTKFHRATGPAA